ncbi:MAG: GNAT family N-acetyltransferase [Nocardioidaceae bacterium]
MSMDVFLETARLRLRRITAADAARLVELDSDPEVMRFITGGKPTSMAAIEHDVLPRLFEEYARFPLLGRWAAVSRATGEFEGWFALRPTERGHGDEVELGYRLRRSAWGRGLATEGSRALVHKAFAELEVRRIYAETMAVNTASRRVLEKTGLTLVRTFHLEWDDPIEGDEHGEVEYELTKLR